MKAGRFDDFAESFRNPRMGLGFSALLGRLALLLRSLVALATHRRLGVRLVATARSA